MVPLLGAQEWLSGGRIQAAKVNGGRESKRLFLVTSPTTHHSADPCVTLLQLQQGWASSSYLLSEAGHCSNT